MEMKKLIWIMFVVVLFMVGCSDSSSESNSNKGESVKTIKVGKEFDIGNVNIEVQTVKVSDDTITVPVWWSHWAGDKKVHLTALAYPIVTQDGEELKEVDGGDSLLKQKDKGVDGRAKVTYELLDDSTPVEIKFKTTADEPEEESIAVELE